MGGLAAWIDLLSAERAFNQQVNSIQRDIAQRFGSSDAVLTSLVGLHHASEDLKTHEFGALSGELLATYPYIRTISKILVMSSTDRASFEEEMRDDGFQQFSVTELAADGGLARAAPRDVTMPIRLFEPLDPEFAQLVGFDVSSDPLLRPAVERAIESGAVIASRLVEYPGIGRGFFVFKAYYLGHEVPRTPQGRKAQVSGLVGLYLQPAQLFQDLIGRYRDYGFRLYQKGGLRSLDSALIYDHPPPASSGIVHFLGPFSSSVLISQQGKIFVLKITRWPAAGAIRGWLAFVLVLVAALAGGMLILALRNHRIGLWHAREGERISRENEKRFRDYAEIASDWFWSTGKDGRFEYVSDQIKNAAGLDPRMFLKRAAEKMPDLTPGDGYHQKHFADSHQRLRFRDVRYKYVDEKGQTQWWSVSGNPVIAEDGQFLGYRGTGRDVTLESEARDTLQKAKEEAEINSRAKSQFLANMSHELRTPLNAIIGFSQIIKDQAIESDGQVGNIEFVQHIHDSGHHLLELINDVLDLSKIESGNTEIQPEWFVVPDMVGAVITIVSGRAEHGEINLDVDLPDTMPRLYADNRMMKQILVNLLSNAIKFTRPGGIVALSVSVDAERRSVFEISDTGIGMAPENIEIALTPFAQIYSDLDRQFEGTGHGLPLAKALVELHDGELIINSEPDVGTTIRVVLPRSRLEQSDGAAETDCHDRPRVAANAE